MSEPVSTLRELFEELARGGDMGATLEGYMTEDCVWENSGLPTAPNRDACVALIRGIGERRGAASLSCKFIDVGIGENGMVLTERIDYLWDADGNLLLEIPLMGAFEFRDGLISHWREYFDPTPMLSGA